MLLSTNQLAVSLAPRLPFPRNQVEPLIAAFFDCMGLLLRKGHEIDLIGIGRFTLYLTPPIKGRLDGKEMLIPPRRAIRLKTNLDYKKYHRQQAPLSFQAPIDHLALTFSLVSQLPLLKAIEIISVITYEINQVIHQGHGLNIVRLGKIYLRERKARKIGNFEDSTKRDYYAPSYYPAFKATQHLKRDIRQSVDKYEIKPYSTIRYQKLNELINRKAAHSTIIKPLLDKKLAKSFK